MRACHPAPAFAATGCFPLGFPRPALISQGKATFGQKTQGCKSKDRLFVRRDVNVLFSQGDDLCLDLWRNIELRAHLRLQVI